MADNRPIWWITALVLLAASAIGFAFVFLGR